MLRHKCIARGCGRRTKNKRYCLRCRERQRRQQRVSCKASKLTPFRTTRHIDALYALAVKRAKWYRWHPDRQVA